MYVLSILSESITTPNLIGNSNQTPMIILILISNVTVPNFEIN